MSYSVYILYSRKANRYYVGHTDNLPMRIARHNATDGTLSYTHKNGPWVLVYAEHDFTSRSDAITRERQIKNWKSRKKIEELIVSSVGRVPTSRD